MSVFKANHQEASAGFEPLPIGEYEAVVTKGEVTKSSTGNDMIKLELTLRDLPEQHAYKGRKFFNNLVFTQNAFPVVQSFLKAVGVPDGTDFPTYQDVVNAVVMKPVRLKNKHQIYNGEKRDSVAYVMDTKHPLQTGEQLPQASAPSAFSMPAAPTPSNSDLPF